MSRVCTSDDCSLTLWQWFGLPMLFYAVWQVVYYLKCYVVDREKLDEHPELQTSERWLLRAKSGPIAKLRDIMDGILGPENRTLSFMICQFIYTSLLMLPTVGLYHNFTAHCIFLVFITAVGVWNGANFYMEQFSKNYLKQFELGVTMAEHLMK
eukprot:GFYU01022766.1.p1 GENE.GFYU01022766.1~~GFYU01022766.1.p1  ORF type:complete len:154 (+),score=44.83 GFYU01022766.1:150-611(+)